MMTIDEVLTSNMNRSQIIEWIKEFKLIMLKEKEEVSSNLETRAKVIYEKMKDLSLIDVPLQYTLGGEERCVKEIEKLLKEGSSFADQLFSQLKEGEYEDIYRINEIIKSLNKITEYTEKTGKFYISPFAIQPKDFRIILSLASYALVQVLKSKKQLTFIYGTYRDHQLCLHTSILCAMI